MKRIILALLCAASAAEAQTCELRPVPGGVTDGVVRKLIMHEGDLVAAGKFQVIQGVAANFVARHRPTGWQPVGDIKAAGMNEVRALCSLDGVLYAGGLGSPPMAGRIVRWDGAAWSELGQRPDRAVQALAEYKGELVAAGLFNYIGTVFNVSVAAWDGANWRGLGTRLDLDPFDGVLALAEFNGDLYAGGGFFITIPSTGTRALARWDGTSWTAVAPQWLTTTATVRDIVRHGSVLAIRSSGSSMPEVSVWDGKTITGVGHFDYPGVATIAEVDGALIAGGAIGLPTSLPAGVRRLARWSGATWLPVVPEEPNGYVYAIAEYGGGLAIGGDLANTGGVPTPYFAQYQCGCYADCNSDGTLDLADFGCFQTKFATGQTYVDCNGDAVRNLADFGCFQTKFALGCP